MKNLKNRLSFSKIWIGVIIVVTLIGGFFTWQYLMAPREVSFTRLVIDDDFDDVLGYIHFIYATAADLDNDGDQDILGVLRGIDLVTDKIVWWRNDGNGIFTRLTIDDTFRGVFNINTTDLDGDGDQDILGTVMFIGNIVWWKNEGNEVFTKFVIDDDFDGATHIHATDLDGDGDQDVLGTSMFINKVAWWRNDGNGVFTKFVIDDNFYRVRSIYATDLDGDGDQDILGTSMFINKVAWWLNDGNGVFTKSIIDNDSGGVEYIYATDLDNDGNQDVLGVTAATDKIIWWENKGNGVFTKIIIDDGLNDDLAYPHFVRATDLDGDGDQDILGIVVDADVVFDITWWRNDLIRNDWLF